MRQELSTHRLRQLRNPGYRKNLADLIDPAELLTSTIQVVRDTAREQQPGKVNAGEGLPGRRSHSPFLINRGTQEVFRAIEIAARPQQEPPVAVHGPANPGRMSGHVATGEGFEQALQVTSVCDLTNGADGIDTGSGSTVIGNTARSNGGDGIDAGLGCIVQSNTVRQNTGYGMRLGAETAYRENVITSNTLGTVTGGVNITTPAMGQRRAREPT